MRCDDFIHSAIEQEKYRQECEKIDELYHHGIQGMKWGIRRFQNEDGSLTPEGRKHKEAIVGKFKEAINNKIPDKKEFGIQTARKLNKAAMDYSQKKRDEHERAEMEKASPKNKLKRALNTDVRDLFRGDNAGEPKKSIGDRFTEAVTSKNLERSMKMMDKMLSNPKTMDYVNKSQSMLNDLSKTKDFQQKYKKLSSMGEEISKTPEFQDFANNMSAKFASSKMAQSARNMETSLRNNKTVQNMKNSGMLDQMANTKTLKDAVGTWQDFRDRGLVGRSNKIY